MLLICTYYDLRYARMCARGVLIISLSLSVSDDFKYISIYRYPTNVTIHAIGSWLTLNWWALIVRVFLWTSCSSLLFSRFGMFETIVCLSIIPTRVFQILRILLKPSWVNLRRGFFWCNPGIPNHRVMSLWDGLHQATIVWNWTRMAPSTRRQGLPLQEEYHANRCGQWIGSFHRNMLTNSSPMAEAWASFERWPGVG